MSQGGISLADKTTFVLYIALHYILLHRTVTQVFVGEGQVSLSNSTMCNAILCTLHFVREVVDWVEVSLDDNTMCNATSCFTTFG